jgi:hypothetical protein
MGWWEAEEVEGKKLTKVVGHPFFLLDDVNEKLSRDQPIND